MMAKRGKGGKKNLKPKQAKGSGKIKSPQDPRRVSTNSLTPLFSFEHLDSQYNLISCETNTKAALIEKLRIISSLTWQNLGQAPKEQYGYEMIPFERINATRPDFLTDDVTQVMVFRYKGNECRVGGYRDDRIFSILYIDPHLDLYSH